MRRSTYSTQTGKDIQDPEKDAGLEHEEKQDTDGEKGGQCSPGRDTAHVPKCQLAISHVHSPQPHVSCILLFNNSPIDQSVDNYYQCGKSPSTRTTCKHRTAQCQIRGTRREWVRPGRWLRGKTHDGMGEGGNDGDGWGSPWGQGGESGASLVDSPLRLTWVLPPFPLSLQPTQPLLSLPVSRIIRWLREMDYAAKPKKRTTHSQKPG